MTVQQELKGKADDKKYRGLANYAQYYEKRDTAQGNAASANVRKGPMRAPANISHIAVVKSIQTSKS